jgi:hypothetical protein
MRAKVTSIGCDKEYGERVVVVEDEQIGDVSIREMEVESLEQFAELAEEVDRIEVSKCNWNKYDFDLTFICGHL